MIRRTHRRALVLIPDVGLLRSSAVVLAGDSTARLLGFLFAVASARLLTPAGYGRIAYALAVAAIVSVLTVNAPFGLSRFLARHQGQPRMLDIYSTNWLVVIALMLGASLTLVIPVALVAGLGGAMLLALMANLLGTAVLQTYRESQKGLGRFWATSTFWALANLLELIAVLIAGALGWRSPALFLTIYGLSSVWALAVMASLAPTALHFVRSLVTRRQVAAIFRFTWPLILQGILYNIWVGADLILVQHFRPGAVGNYAVAKTFVLALMVPPAAISTVLAPRMARLGAHAIRTYLLAATVVPLLILGMVCYGLYLVLATSWAWGLGRPQIDPAATAVAMVVTVTLGLMLVPGAGLLGAAFAYTAGAVSQLVVIGGFTVWAVFAGATPRLGPARELVLDTERLAEA